MMAGVIASVSLHNEKDTRAVVKQFSVSKSNYILPEFDQTFQPAVHNIFYIRLRASPLSELRLIVSIQASKLSRPEEGWAGPA